MYCKYLFLFYLIAFSIACSENILEKEEKFESYMLTVSPSYCAFPPSGGEIAFKVDAKKITSITVDNVLVSRTEEDTPYTVEIDGEGFSFENSIVHATPNQSSTIRAGLLTVKLTKSMEEVQVNLFQNVAQETSSFPLPGGKKNYTVVYAHLTLTDSTWAQLSNIEFCEKTGTFKEVYWYWSTSLRKGKTYLHTYTCTVDGKTGPVSIYSPTGWVAPSGHSKSSEGVYLYNEKTGVLEMIYNKGKHVIWIANPVQNAGGLAKMSFSSSSFDVTHGVGFGSNADWGVFKTLAEIPRIQYYGKGVSVMSIKQGSPENILRDSWYTHNMNLQDYAFSDDKTVLFWHQPLASFEDPDGPSPHKGVLYHLWATNNSRAMVWNNYMALLAGDAFPTYNRNLHPHAVQQIINDKGELKGFVILEQQNPPEQYYDTNYQYQINYKLDNTY